MVETAAHLADHVFTRLPVRQWVLSVPKRLRYFLQRDVTPGLSPSSLRRLAHHLDAGFAGWARRTAVLVSAGLPPPRPMIQCESYNTIVALLAKTDMLDVMQRRMLKEPFARDYLQEIPIADTMPSLTADIFTHADAPLARVAAQWQRPP